MEDNGLRQCTKCGKFYPKELFMYNRAQKRRKVCIGCWNFGYGKDNVEEAMKRSRRLPRCQKYYVCYGYGKVCSRGKPGFVDKMYHNSYYRISALITDKIVNLFNDKKIKIIFLYNNSFIHLIVKTTNNSGLDRYVLEHNDEYRIFDLVYSVDKNIHKKFEAMGSDKHCIMIVKDLVLHKTKKWIKFKCRRSSEDRWKYELKNALDACGFTEDVNKEVVKDGQE